VPLLIPEIHERVKPRKRRTSRLTPPPFHVLRIHNSLRNTDCIIMRSIIPLLSLSALLVPVQSLYFYIDGTSPKCFFEELPKDTLVVGDYTAEEYDDNRKMWSKHDGLNVFISVDVNSPLLNAVSLRYAMAVANSHFRKYSITTTVWLLRRVHHQAASPSVPRNQETTRSASRPPQILAAQTGSQLCTHKVALN
jgi:hypothetical protein